MRNSQGFSLIEMSIVLVMIAGLAALIIGGQSLLATSKANTTAQESQKYMQAIALFKEQFSALPGDFMGATARWTSLDSNTSNGNGDGVIATASEGIAAWHHLRMAKMLENSSFTGVGGTLSPGINLPASKAYEKAGFQLAGSVSVFSTNLGNALLLGRNNSNTDMTYGTILSRDAELVDKKLDDGLAGSGNVWAASGKDNASAKCTDKSWNGALPAVYTLTDTTGLCYMAFRLTSDRY